MILEKCENKEDVINNLIKILKNTPKDKSRENLKRIVMYLYENMEEESKNQIIKLIEESESEENMLRAKRIINAEIRKERLEGIVEGIKQTIERMIKMNLEDDFISKATGSNKSSIEKIRKELEE